MTAEHQIELIGKQIRGGWEKAKACTASMYKGGGNNGVTYIIELYETD